MFNGAPFVDIFDQPWCEHCKKLLPELEKLEECMEEQKIQGVQIAKVDGTEAVATSSLHSVKHYPTLLFVYAEKFHVYSGVRTSEGLLSFAQRLRSGKKVLPYWTHNCNIATCFIYVEPLCLY